MVHECHQNQGGNPYKVMKAMLPKAVFTGFTGTLLLAAKDRATSMELSGQCIHRCR
ncbi:MAG: hypothetical protein ACHQ4F_07985 [Candidatus Dormibacteria bacterium]